VPFLREIFHDLHPELRRLYPRSSLRGGVVGNFCGSDIRMLTSFFKIHSVHRNYLGITGFGADSDELQVQKGVQRGGELQAIRPRPKPTTNSPPSTIASSSFYRWPMLSCQLSHAASSAMLPHAAWVPRALCTHSSPSGPLPVG
jgi:hypothetical protein